MKLVVGILAALALVAKGGASGCGDPEAGSPLVNSFHVSLSDSKVTYACAKGFRYKSGDWERTCNSDGKWSGASLKCTGNCVKDCAGLPDGDYQSCSSCGWFLSCVGGTMIAQRPCPSNLVWDDQNKWCGWLSATCWDCVNDCTGKADGDYQACDGCGYYYTCSNGRTYNRECPVLATGSALVWDDRNKRCDWESQTCTKSTYLNPQN